MKPSNFIVRIPEPCHEDWNKMQPDEKGKFCSSCSTSVIDFSNKTDAEIRTILMENKGQKMCGHFKKAQVDRPLNIRLDLNDLPKNMSITKTFVIALFIVFGTMLFSCTNEKDETIGKIYVEPQQKENIITGATLGEIVWPFADTISQIQTEVIVNEELFMKGDICIHEEYVEGRMIPEEIFPLEDSTASQKDSTTVTETTEMITMGLIVYEAEPKDSTVTSNDTLSGRNSTNLIEKNNTKQTDLFVYPNPSKGEFTIKYDITKRANVVLEIFDIKGSLIKTVENVSNHHEGRYQIPVSLHDLPSGIYIVSLINNDRKFTEKVVIEK